MDVRQVGNLLVARWWGSGGRLNKIVFNRYVKSFILFLEKKIRRSAFYDTYYVVAVKG